MSKPHDTDVALVGQILMYAQPTIGKPAAKEIDKKLKAKLLLIKTLDKYPELKLFEQNMKQAMRKYKAKK